MTFTGFSVDALAFLTKLGSQNKDWFQANRKVYDSEVAGPAKDFVVAMTDALQDRVSPLIEGHPKTNGSIAPINNDLRFNPGASPYKDHLLLKWWEGDTKKLAPTLWVRLSAESVGFASGIALADLDRWRTAVGGESGSALGAAINDLSDRYDLDVAGEALKKVPKPFPEDHPRAALLRHKAFQVRTPVATPPSVSSAEFVDWCVDHLDHFAPVHRWLTDHLA